MKKTLQPYTKGNFVRSNSKDKVLQSRILFVHYLIEYYKSPRVIRKTFRSQFPKRLILDKIHPNVPYSPVVHIGMLFRLYTNISMLSTKLQLTDSFT